MSWLITGISKAPLLLDTYSGAAAAYSLRQLSWAYGGPAVRVRRSNDNAEQDFTATQVSDGTLAAWVGAGNNGFVRTWYDQSGNGGNAVQSTNALQPTIVSNGSLVTQAGKAATSFTGSGVRLEAPHLIQRARLDSYIVKNTSDTDYLLFGGNTSTGFSWLSTSASSNANLTGGGYGGSLYANNQLFVGATRGQIYSFLDGYKLEVHQGASTSGGSWVAFDIGVYNRSTLDFTGSIQELVFYASDQSANRTAIQSNINAHYAIY